MFQSDLQIEAWANGPVVRDLYEQHRGMFMVEKLPKGDIDALDADARETIDSVLATYAEKTSQWLSNLTHQEDPWRNARAGFRPGEKCDRVISLSAMVEYYGSLG